MQRHTEYLGDNQEPGKELRTLFFVQDLKLLVKQHRHLSETKRKMVEWVWVNAICAKQMKKSAMVPGAMKMARERRKTHLNISKLEKAFCWSTE